jgi:penicillin amidase
VVAGSKTRTGRPILANDPHLGLQLPSVWYEAQLNCPDFDVYGVTLPGEPFVVIGFNRYIAWGMTNCGWDVTDLYRETFDNERHDHYLFKGNWHPVEKIPQVIHVKDEPDTTIILEYTHRGPIIARTGEYFSMQWTGNQINFDGVTVYYLNKARNYNDYRQALQFYGCPAQNFVYGDLEGNIAITCTGKNPIRKNGFGRSVTDGSNDQSEWIGFTPFQELPTSLNPEQGYLASANQQPINQAEPYFGWDWPTDYRARRINTLLKNHNQLDAKDIMRFQTDVYAVRAEVFVPFILQAFEKQTDLLKDAAIDSMLHYLKNWNYKMRKDEVGATIFDSFMNNFISKTWTDHSPECGFLLPNEFIIERLAKNDPGSKWFDDVTTPEKEDRDEIIRRSLLDTKNQLTAELGPMISSWKWERYHKTSIPHLSRLKPLGIDPFPNNGGIGTVNVGPGRTNSFGPSWRMIVSLEQPIRAWGVYPGGQSGNPASKHYIDFVETWKNEQYFKLLFPEKPSDLSPEVIESQISIISRTKQ